MGRAIPLLLLTFFVADVSARFLPVDPLAFRAWEALSRYRPLGAAFEPGRRFVREDSYGDAANLGNLPEMRQYRPEVFTTDARGFRNVDPSARGGIRVILAGDSFAVGSGVPDGDTLAPALSALLGCEAYNAAGLTPDPERLGLLARQLGMSSGVVLHAHADDNEPPGVPSETDRAMERRFAQPYSAAGPLIGRVRGFLFVSPLQIAIERGFKRVSNDRVLPNGYASNVVIERLANGDWMLFVRSRVDYVRSERAASPTYWRWLAAGLREAGLQLVVVLIPSKYNVYQPMFASGDRGQSGQPPFLDRLERELTAVGIPTINLTAPVTAEAARLAPGGQYIYWRDDIHWNADGIQFAASHLVGAPTPLKQACTSERATMPTVP
jgi:hypothetical protein